MKTLPKLQSFILTLYQEGLQDRALYDIYNRLSSCRYLENLSLGYGRGIIDKEHILNLSRLLSQVKSLKSLYFYFTEAEFEFDSFIPFKFLELNELNSVWLRIQNATMSENDLSRIFWIWTQAKNITEINLEVSNIKMLSEGSPKLKDRALPNSTSINQDIKKVRVKLEIPEKSAKFLYKLGKNFSQWIGLDELSITIDDKKFITGGYRALGRELPYLVKLKTFTVNLPEASEYPHRNREGCFEIANAVQHFEDLEELNISINNAYSWDKTVDTYLFIKGLSLSFAKTRNIKKLSISAKGNKEVCTRSIEAIAEGLKYLHGLKELSLKFGDLNIKDSDLQILLKAMAQLKELEIVFLEWKNPVTLVNQSLNSLLEYLSVSRQLKGGAMFFDGNQITREGLVEFLICLSQLKLSSYLFISLARSKNINQQDLNNIKRKARDKLFLNKSVRVKI